MFGLQGRVAVITGASGGLGSAIAMTLAMQGAHVVLFDRHPALCEAQAERLREAGYLASVEGCDLRDDEALKAAVARTIAACGGVDILVCNAGIPGCAGPLGERSDADWEDVMSVNLRAAWRLTSLVIPQMARRRTGSVILMSSIAGVRGNRDIGLYGLSKAALAQLARNLAVEWGPSGVRVNAISPGLIRTPMSDGLLSDAEFMKRRLAATPLRRVGEPQEIAGVVLLLASASGAFITGQNLVVDGGTTISDGT